MNDSNRQSPPAVSPSPRPLLFQRLRWRLLNNSARQLLGHSGVRVVTILACSALVWACVYGGSRWGFHFMVQQRLPFIDNIVATVFDLFFLSLALMLTFSTGIILYASLFASAETAFLLNLPAPADRVFAYKFQGALAFSSWAFLLLGSAVFVPYGTVFGAPWYFYVLLPVFLLGFVLVPATLGALTCLLVVRTVPRRRRQLVVGAVLLLVALTVLWGIHVARTTREAGWTRDAVMLLLAQFDFARGTLMPNDWMVRGLMAARTGDLRETSYRLALLWSNGLFGYVLTGWAARRLYRRAYNRVATGGSLRRRYGGLWLDKTLAGLVAFLHPQVRLLLIKDFRTFRRDPAQWAQILIFAGLMCLYFLYTISFYQEGIELKWRMIISLLNLAATGVLLCAWTGRFIYPLLSLEGRKFWVLGLLPLRRDLLVWGKFAFSGTLAILFAEVLVTLSDVMLLMPPWRTDLYPVLGLQTLAVDSLGVVVLGVGLSGLSVGIGACLPNFRETDPSKIATGYGGTFNLIASLLFLVLVIVTMAAPWHLYAAVGEGEHWTQASVGWVLAGMLGGVALGTAAVFVPLRLGARTLRQMEF
jgi:ABC-2 type transport system permease protein